MRLQRLLVLGALLITLVATADASAVAMPLKVMSFNIRRLNRDPQEPNGWAGRREHVIESIREFDPDLLGMQEAYGAQVEELRAALPGYAVVSRGRDKSGLLSEASPVFFKQARFEKLDSGVFWLSDTPDTPGSVGWDAALPRLVTWIKLRDIKDGVSFLWMNTHWDHKGKNARLQSAKLMRAKVDAAPREVPLLPTGDFTTPEKLEPYR